MRESEKATNVFLEDIKDIGQVHFKISVKGALSNLRQFSATETPLKMMKNTFAFTLKALFVLKIFKVLS